MTTEANKTIVRRFHEAYNRGDLAGCEAVLSPNLVYSQPGSPPLDLAGYRAIGEMFRAAFPDGADVIDDQVAEGDRVATRVTFHGTHPGELMGIPATGKELTMVGMVFDRVEGGRIVERHALFDQLGMLRQLGVIPTG